MPEEEEEDEGVNVEAEAEGEEGEEGEERGQFAHPFFAVAFLCPGVPWPQSHGLATAPFALLPFW